jgi:hypothetical protein
MGGIEDVHVTRRGLLQGVGALGGVAALGGLAGIDARPAVAQDRIATLAAEIGATAVTPGLTYVALYFDPFLPPIISDTSNRVVGNSSVSGTLQDLVASVPLPSGVRIKEVAFVATNQDSSSSDPFELHEIDLGTLDDNTIASMTFPQGLSPTFQSVSIDHVTSAGCAYRALAPARPGHAGITAVRVGYQGPLAFHPVNPQVRKLDTREPGPLTGKLLSGQTRTLSLAPDVPAGASAALVNITLDATEGGGFVSLFPADIAWPGTSSINWYAAGQIVANAATVAVSPSQQIKLLAASGGGAAHVIIDLLGYYA